MLGRVGDAQVLAVAVVDVTRVPARLARRVEDHNVHDVIKLALDQRSVLAVGFVDALDGFGHGVRPVDEVAVLGEPERSRKVGRQNATVGACGIFQNRRTKSRNVNDTTASNDHIQSSSKAPSDNFSISK